MRADVLLREARAAAGLTQEEVARRMGTTQSAVARLERPGANPRFVTLDRALRATGHELDARSRRHVGSVDPTLVESQLAIPPAERLKVIERSIEQARRVWLAGARQRGELA